MLQSRKIFNFKKIPVVIAVLLLALVVYPNGAAGIISCGLPVCPSSGTMAPGGCGGKGIGGVGPTRLPAISCRQCACWCGHPECCCLFESVKAVVAPADWLYNSAQKTCGCATPAFLGLAHGMQRAQPPTAQEVQNLVNRTAGQFKYDLFDNANIVAVDGFRYGSCSGMVSWWWEQLGLPTLGTPGTTLGMADIPPSLLQTSSLSIGSLNPADIIFLDFGTDMTHVGMYLGDGLVAEMTNPTDNILISDLKEFWSRGEVIGIVKVPGY